MTPTKIDIVDPMGSTNPTMKPASGTTREENK